MYTASELNESIAHNVIGYDRTSTGDWQCTLSCIWLFFNGRLWFRDGRRSVSVVAIPGLRRFFLDKQRRVVCVVSSTQRIHDMQCTGRHDKSIYSATWIHTVGLAYVPPPHTPPPPAAPSTIDTACHMSDIDLQVPHGQILVMAGPPAGCLVPP